MRTRSRTLEIILQSLRRTGRLKRIYKAYVIHEIKYLEKLRDNIGYLSSWDKMLLDSCHDIMETYCTYLRLSHLRLVS